MRKPLQFAFVLGVFFLVAARGQVGEYQVKAAFLYNFARFVEWPHQAFSGPDDPIAICVLGQNPFGKALDEVVGGKTVDGRPFVVRQISGAQPQGACQILFVHSSERLRFRSMLGNLGTGVLTVGEAPGFAAEGGIINFKLEDGKIRFEINLEAAGQQQLRISSRLLSLAEIARK